MNPINVPREKMAAIAWLHQDELEAIAPEPRTTRGGNQPLRVQTVLTDGVRLTFQAQAVSDGFFLGSSTVFGDCRVDLSLITKLLFGHAINSAVKQQSHQLLTLTPAVVPRFVTADSTSPTPTGQVSALVGSQAPPVRLHKLDGSKFDLADHRGKVVVLDFWATWCGPCIQWLPQLETIVAKYSGEEVELVTINLLQTKEAVLPALERMQLSPTVLLDIDGVVADAYQATLIPQTVIIDQEGMVARLFIGGSAEMKQPVIDALDALTSKPGAN